MIAKEFIIIFISLSILSLEVAAQEYQSKETKKKSILERSISLIEGKSKKDVSDKKERKSDECDKVNKLKKSKVENTDSTQFYKHLADSLLQVLNDRHLFIEYMKRKEMEDSLKVINLENNEKELLLLISEKDIIIEDLKANVSSVDTSIVKLANRWLFEQYDGDAVNDQITFFDNVCSSELKKKYYVVRELLSIYEECYREFQMILNDAQNDRDRIQPFSFVCEDYRNRYIDRIKNMPYYKKYHEDSAEWCIVYLSESIDKVLEIIGNHSENNFADFSLLIDEEFLQQGVK